MSFEELLPYLIALIATAIAVLTVLYVTRFKKKEEEEKLQPSPKLEAVERWRFRTQRSISLDDAKGAKDELTTLS